MTVITLFTEEEVLKVVDCCFHMYASDYRYDAKDVAKEIMKGMSLQKQGELSVLNKEKKCAQCNSKEFKSVTLIQEVCANCGRNVQ
jgi:hypothetical protein